MEVTLMPAFVININGRKACAVALNGENTGTINITWIGDQKDDEGLIYFHVGATDEDQNLRWSVPELKIGDEVTIKIIEASVGDPPTSRKAIDQTEPET
jgi:hypothetical protein